MKDDAGEEARLPVVPEDDLFRVAKKHNKGFKIIAPPEPTLEAPVVDTHAHLGLIDAPLSLARCAVHGVSFVVCMAEISDDADRVYDGIGRWKDTARAKLSVIATDIADSIDVPRTRIAVGCHPHEARRYDDRMEARLRERLADPRTCAVGEVGLDYHYDLSSRDDQRRVFRRQIALSHETGLPLILHVREAHEEALGILRDEGIPDGGVLLHCCGLSPEEIGPWVDLGCYISYGGSVTFKSSDAARQGLACVPRNRLLTETDAPFMAPVPLRGTVCAPECTIFTAALIAEVLGCSPGVQRGSLLRDIAANAASLLGREATPWQNASR